MPLDDVQEVSNYVAAMNHGLQRLAGGFPLSLRLIQEMHRELLRGRGAAARQPGEFRRSQNWIGGARPGDARIRSTTARARHGVHERPRALPARANDLPTLIQAALAHVQFETIHPFLDGNGRLGRLLITLMLCAEGALKEPILYLSLYFKTQRASYYDLLQRVRPKGDWEAWLGSFSRACSRRPSRASPRRAGSSSCSTATRRR